MLDTFAYIGAFSPAPGLLPDSRRAYVGQFSEEEFKIENGKNPPKFILICTGNSDDVVDNTPNLYHKTLVKNGVDHMWYTIDGGHDFVVWKSGLYNFVKRIFK
ncbi:hypothetical protein [Clostridium oryzae]|uniref:Endo-1,4-beta-xylanase Z n=1 Tax=Clostridium oryzae TaxID=1450648 RepID=A0A1V4IVF0_9CLOT|nr:hypothetical protein [Clostridium oryzae]OPJ64038.1 endo-1,4-beta-xylanase Z precursor [Clostridium oryzae]